jgi:hypothetical protein
LGESLHASADFSIREAINCDALQVVQITDRLWNDFAGDANVFVAVQRCAQEEVFKVDRHDAVEKRFDSCYIRCFGAGRVPRIINAIAANGVTNVFWIGLFWAIGANDANIRGDASIWHLRRMNVIDGVGAGWGPKALGESS